MADVLRGAIVVGVMRVWLLYEGAVDPLMRHLYLNLPTPVGFGGTHDAAAVCAELTRNSDAAFWRGSYAAAEECERLLAARVASLHLSALLLLACGAAAFGVRRWAHTLDTAQHTAAFIAALRELSPWRARRCGRSMAQLEGAETDPGGARGVLRCARCAAGGGTVAAGVRDAAPVGFVDTSPHPERSAAFLCSTPECTPPGALHTRRAPGRA